MFPFMMSSLSSPFLGHPAPPVLLAIRPHHQDSLLTDATENSVNDRNEDGGERFVQVYSPEWWTSSLSRNNVSVQSDASEPGSVSGSVLTLMGSGTNHILNIESVQDEGHGQSNHGSIQGAAESTAESSIQNQVVGRRRDYPDVLGAAKVKKELKSAKSLFSSCFISQSNQSEPVLVGFKKEMNRYNFPQGKICSASDVANRLSLFENIMITNESVSRLKDQLLEYRSTVAKQSGEKEVAGAGAMMMASDGARFDYPALHAIREIRDFCRKYASDCPASNISPSDFESLGVCVASSIALQAMENEGFGDFADLQKSINSESGDEEIKNQFRKYFFPVCDWIEGESEELPAHCKSIQKGNFHGFDKNS